MQWIITRDLINKGSDTRIGYKRAKTTWRESYDTTDKAGKELMLAQFKANMTDEFRLFDGDNELYYEGLCLDLDEQDGDHAFQPLNWAENDVGCTHMEYRKKGATQWKPL